MLIPDWLWQSWVGAATIAVAKLAWNHRQEILRHCAATLDLLTAILETATLSPREPLTLTPKRSVETQNQRESRTTVAETFVDVAPKIAELMRENPSPVYRVAERFAAAGIQFESPVTRAAERMGVAMLESPSYKKFGALGRHLTIAAAKSAQPLNHKFAALGRKAADTHKVQFTPLGRKVANNLSNRTR